MRALAAQFFEALLEIASPPRCMACDEPSRTALCASCSIALPDARPRLVAGVPLVAAARYAPPIDGVIHRFKYSGRPDLARGLASLFPPELDLEDALLVPVPLHPRRLAERGYNQAALLAAALARRHGGFVRARGLARRRHTEQQARLGRAERHANLDGAFEVIRPAALAGRRVLLVDDVVTTGSTAAACIGALGRAGARVGGVLAVATAD
jgi:ComF family protein